MRQTDETDRQTDRQILILLPHPLPPPHHLHPLSPRPHPPPSSLPTLHFPHSKAWLWAYRQAHTHTHTHSQTHNVRRVRLSQGHQIGLLGGHVCPLAVPSSVTDPIPRLTQSDERQVRGVEGWRGDGWESSSLGSPTPPSPLCIMTSQEAERSGGGTGIKYDLFHMRRNVFLGGGVENTPQSVVSQRLQKWLYTKSYRLDTHTHTYHLEPFCLYTTWY